VHRCRHGGLILSDQRMNETASEATLLCAAIDGRRGGERAGSGTPASAQRI
jgi:hypothetical protein